MTHDMDPTAGTDADTVATDIGTAGDLDPEAVVDELDVDAEAPLDEAAPSHPDSERVVPEAEELEASS